MPAPNAGRLLSVFCAMPSAFQPEVLPGAFLSPADFARHSGLSLSTVSRYLASGRLPKIQFGGRRCRVLIPRAALDGLPNLEPPPPYMTVAARSSLLNNPVEIGLYVNLI
jgi:hypothetical protein